MKKPFRRRVLHPATLTGLEPATSAVTGRRANQLRYRAMVYSIMMVASDPNGIRTRAAAVKGRCPRPLNDGAEARHFFLACYRDIRLRTSSPLRKSGAQSWNPWRVALRADGLPSERALHARE